MYSLDINLLSERAEYQNGKQTNFTDGTAIARPKFGKTPLFIGMGIGALSLLATGGGWWWTNQQTTQLEAKQKDLDQKLGSLKIQEQRLQAITTQVDQVKNESQSLAGVFNQVQPWSAILQDLRENIPQGVQVASVNQGETKVAPPPVAPAAAPAPSGGGLAAKISTPPNPEASLANPGASPKPGASPAPAAGASPAPAAPIPPTASAAPLPADVPTTTLAIAGTAKSFDEVNNFVLTLKQSAFFNPDDTYLISAGLTAPVALEKIKPITATGDKISPAQQQQIDKLNRLELPKVVDYKITTSLKRIPSADLIRELERKGAVGLVTRLRTLQQQQAIKP
jgi:type IV pilus assembly protein PilN